MYFPKHMKLIKQGRAWLGHMPFGYDLVKGLKPKVLVELGTHYGGSYFTFIESIIDNRLPTQCYAIDTWEGDEQAGFYGDDVYNFVKELNKTHSEHSHLLRMRFEDAVAQFDDNSIDLLHIDGLHTYDAVKNDFETWYEKVSENGFILFHDTIEEKEGFGVKQFWSELCKEYPDQCFNFEFSHGLGVYCKNPSIKISVLLEKILGKPFPKIHKTYSKYSRRLTISFRRRKNLEKIMKLFSK